MKKLKALINLIKVSSKAKLIVGVVSGVIVIGGSYGGYYLYSRYLNDAATISREEATELSKNKEDINKESKEYDDKFVKLNELKKSLSERDKDFTDDREISEKNIDQILDEYTKKLETYSKDEKEEDKKLAEQKENEKEKIESSNTPTSGGNPSSAGSGSSGGGSSSSGGGSSSSGGSTTPSKPDPVTPSEPDPTPSKPSGWRNDISDSIAGRSYTPNTNCTSGENKVMTDSQLANLNSWADQWLNGSINSLQFIANAKADSQSKIEGYAPTYLTNISIVKEVFNGEDPSSMYPTTSGHNYIWCRAYYDGNSNTTTVYMISGTMSRPGQ